MGRPFRLPFDAVYGENRYFLTICTHDRQRYFTDATAVASAWSQFLRYSERDSFGIIAYCFMPDHLHLLVEGWSPEASLRRFVRAAKQGSGYHFTQRTGLRLWQVNYFDRTLRRDDALAHAVAYLINNPLRGGLVASIDEYPFWGSGIWTRTELLEFVGTQRRT